MLEAFFVDKFSPWQVSLLKEMALQLFNEKTCQGTVGQGKIRSKIYHTVVVYTRRPNRTCLWQSGKLAWQQMQTLRKVASFKKVRIGNRMLKLHWMPNNPICLLHDVHCWKMCGLGAASNNTKIEMPSVCEKLCENILGTIGHLAPSFCG